MNSERMKQFISLLLAGSMALGLLLPGVSAFAEDGFSFLEFHGAQNGAERLTSFG